MEGVILPIPTPFDEKGNLFLDGYQDYLDFLIEKGVNGFMVGGTNGEFHVMDVEERKKLLEFVVRKYKGKVRIIAHVGTTHMKETLELLEHAMSLNVDAVSIVSPYYFKYDEESLVYYFSEIARSFPSAKILLYNIPSFSGNELKLKTILKIKERAENVIGLKDTDRRPWIVPTIKKELGEEFCVLGGMDSFALSYLANGADGLITGTGNVFPELMVSLYKNWREGNIEKAKELQMLLIKAIENVSGRAAFMITVKEALRIRGFHIGYPRSPWRRLRSEELKELKEFIEEFLKELSKVTS